MQAWAGHHELWVLVSWKYISEVIDSETNRNEMSNGTFEVRVKLVDFGLPPDFKAMDRKSFLSRLKYF